MTDPVQRSADEAAITRLLYAYCDAVDANRTEEIIALFTVDAVFDLGYGRVYTGAAQLATLFRRLDFYRATSHDLSTVVIDFDDDSARCHSHVYAFHLRADNGAPVHLWGRYSDVVVRDSDEWYRMVEKNVPLSASAARRRSPTRPCGSPRPMHPMSPESCSPSTEARPPV